MVEGRGELAYPRAVLDVVLAVDVGRRDGYDVVVELSMMCRWKLWPVVVDPGGGANARTEGTTVRRQSNAPVEVEGLPLGLLVHVGVVMATNPKMTVHLKRKDVCVILVEFGVMVSL